MRRVLSYEQDHFGRRLQRSCHFDPVYEFMTWEKIEMPNRNDPARRVLFERLSRLQGSARHKAPHRRLSPPHETQDPGEIQRKRFTRRTLMLGAGSLGLFGLLAGKLYNLQNIEGRKYKSLADDNRLATRFLPSIRGRIYDRGHELVASNTENLRILLIPDQAKNIEASLDKLARTIAIPPERRRQILRTAQRQNPQIPILVVDGLRWGQFARINVVSARIPGIVGDVGWKRQYHFDEKFAHIVGHLGQPDDLQLAAEPALRLPGSKVGVAGIEQGFDKVLRGTPGRLELEMDARGRTVRKLASIPPRNGKDLYLTIDHVLQRRILDRLSHYRRAAAVAIDVNSGDVVAICSTPSFDPNIFTSPVDEKAWKKLRKNPDHPLSDKATRGQYPPGSTFKMVTALAGLEAGVITPETRFRCTGAMEWQKHKFHCWKRSGHGYMHLHTALKQSCDVYFYQTARKLGIARLAAMARTLGLGQTYDCGLPGQKPGLIPDPDWKLAAKRQSWYGGETVLAAIGQGYVLSTPLQLAVMTARLATGRRVEPRLARTKASPPAAAAYPELDLDANFLKLVRKAMVGVIHDKDGTAPLANLDWPGIKMAGKTGTSQVRRLVKGRRGKKMEWKYRDHALFVSFAPAKNPRYALSVIIEHGESGGKVAGPVARDIMKMLLVRDPAGQSSQITRQEQLSSSQSSALARETQAGRKP